MTTMLPFKDYPANLHVALAGYGLSVRDADRISLALSEDNEEAAIQILEEKARTDERGARIILREAMRCRAGKPAQCRGGNYTMELPA